ncbi:MAG TPA: Hpt domain-containing protein, partial [Pyrinomonadaceae bacterium]|nr:Hpt domain-containing protein [Pyrinomonadaceae bacterium]
MNPILFPAFLDEALGLLPRLRRTLLRFASGECPVSEIQTSASSVSSLAKSANLLGLAEIAEASHLLESLLFDISKAANPNLEKINNTLDQITHLETILLNETFGNDKDSKEIESYLDDKVAILINEKSDTYQTSYENPTEPKGIAEFKTIDKDFVPGQLHIHEHENSHSDYLKPEDFQTGSFQTEGFQSSGFQSSLEADSFEVDDELQEVFAEEANQLLNDIENALEKLRIDSGNRELLWETRRAAHTLKGSAGIVGFKAVSELSHRVEDLLEAMAERGIEASQSLLDLIAESTNALRALASNGQSETLTDIAELYSKFDQALEQISNTFAEPPPSESNSQIVENIFNNLESGPISTHKQSEPAVDNSCE